MIHHAPRNNRRAYPGTKWIVQPLHYLVVEIHLSAPLRWKLYTIAATVFRSSTNYSSPTFHKICTGLSLKVTLALTRKAVTKNLEFCLKITSSSCNQYFILTRYNQESSKKTYRGLPSEYHNYTIKTFWNPHLMRTSQSSTQQLSTLPSWQFYDKLSTLRVVAMTRQHYWFMMYHFYSNLNYNMLTIYKPYVFHNLCCALHKCPNRYDNYYLYQIYDTGKH